MARILVTGSTEGIGRNAARALMDEGHEVVLHARNRDRAARFAAERKAARAVLTGDLGSMADLRALAQSLNEIGPMDAIIHNVGIIDDRREVTTEGMLRVLMVNAIAPYVLSALADRPKRLIFTGSSMHFGHDGVLEDLQWQSRHWSGQAAYGESKLLVTALSNGLARLWPERRCHTVDPGWVPTRMGGRSASDDLGLAHVTQNWLASSEDAGWQETGGYWYHMQPQRPDAKTLDPAFQDAVLRRFADLSGVALPSGGGR